MKPNSPSASPRKRPSHVKPLTWSLVVTLLFAITPTAMGKTISVSPGGAETSTSASSIQSASNKAYAGDIVMIAEGTYREAIRPPRSGTSGEPIVYMAKPGDSVVVSGLDDILGTWENAGGQVWRSPEVNQDLGRGRNQLFFNGERMTCARWPNSPDIMDPNLKFLSSHPVKSGDTMSFTHSELTQPTGYWNGAFLVMWVYASRCQTATITEYTQTSSGGNIKAKLHMDQWSPSGNKHAFYIVDHRNAVDAAGEYFFNWEEKRFYAMFPGGANPNQNLISARSPRQIAFDLSDRSYITIKNLKIEGATVETETGLDRNFPDSYSSITAHDIIMDGLHVYCPNHYIALTDGHIWEPMTKASGVVMAGSRIVFKNGMIEWAAGAGVTGGGGPECKLLGSIIRNVACSGAGAAVAFGTSDQDDAFDEKYDFYADFTEIGYNVVERFGTVGIGMNGIRGGRIHHNIIRQGVMLSDDQGAIYGWNQDLNRLEIDHNIISDMRRGSITHYNIRTGIYFDNRCRNAVAHHNSVRGCTRVLEAGVDHDFQPTHHGFKMIFNNTFEGEIASGFQQNQPYGNWGNVYANNICTGGQSNIARDSVIIVPENLWSSPGFDNSQFYHTIRSGGAAHNKGRVMAPYTNGYGGFAPDLGCRELGQDPWVAGPDGMPENWESVGTTTFNAASDAVLSETQKSQNFGSNSRLLVSHIDNATSRVLVSFILTGMEGQEIREMRIRLKESPELAAGDVPFAVYAVTESWDESSVTWNSMPNIREDLWTMGAYTPGVHPLGWDKSVGEDVTMDIKVEPRFFNGDGSYSFMFIPLSLGQGQPDLAFMSKESGSGPQMIVKTSDPSVRIKRRGARDNADRTGGFSCFSARVTRAGKFAVTYATTRPVETTLYVHDAAARRLAAIWSSAARTQALTWDPAGRSGVYVLRLEDAQGNIRSQLLTLNPR